MTAPSPPAKPSQRPLNPEMVYPPLTPHGSNDALLHDDDDDGGSIFKIPLCFKLPISIVFILRIVVLILAFVDWIFWAERVSYSDVFHHLVFTFLLFLIIWSIFLIGYKRSISKYLCPGCGAFVCQIGPVRCILGHPGEDGDDNNDVEEPPKTKKTLRLSWVVDFTFAITLLVFGIIAENGWPWYYRNRHVHIIVLLYLVVSFEFVIGFLTFFSILPFKIKSVALTIHTSRSSLPSYRIRLPQQQDVRALRGQQISVQA